MKKLVSLAIVVAWLMGACLDSEAMCPLCKARVESSLDNKEAKGLNAGILYLLVMPYILVGGIGYWWYVTYRKDKGIAMEEVD